MIEVINPSWSWVGLSLSKLGGITKHLEECGRTCYKSEDRITKDSADKFVEKICRNRHESVLEHECLTVRFVCSRACSHQLVRHRLGAYSQESMRFCDYGKVRPTEFGGPPTRPILRVICPPRIGIPVGFYHGKYYGESLGAERNAWVKSIDDAYCEYLAEVERGIPPEDARFLLPNATKTEVVTTYNLRMWRHVFQERALNPHAQWEIRELMGDLLYNMKCHLPAVFGDLK